MALYALGDVAPTVHDTAFIHPDATVIGDVTIGGESSVWPGAVLRGDHGTITVGSRTSIQDGSVVHAGPTFPTKIGDGCVVGHIVHLEGCTIEDDALIGSGAVVLQYVVVGQRRPRGSGGGGAQRDRGAARCPGRRGPCPHQAGQRRTSSSSVSRPRST